MTTRLRGRVDGTAGRRASCPSIAPRTPPPMALRALPGSLTRALCLIAVATGVPACESSPPGGDVTALDADDIAGVVTDPLSS